LSKHEGRENRLKKELVLFEGSASVIPRQQKQREKYMRRKEMRIDAKPKPSGRPRNLYHVCKHCYSNFENKNKKRDH
jgi:hypothetical protein